MTGPKKMTDKQLAANLHNARRSTGPRTPDGKAVSRWNALKHGLLAKAIIPPALARFESQGDFNLLLETLREGFDPASAIEEILIERLAACYWRMGRLMRAESGGVAHRLETAENSLQIEKRLRGYDHVPSVSAGLEERIQSLSRAKGNAERLRKWFAAQDPTWQMASEEELGQAATRTLAELRGQLAQQEAQELDTMRALRNAPSSTEAAVMVRYETMLERQFYQALQALERIQRMRGGEFVPPPLVVDVTQSDDGSG